MSGTGPYKRYVIETNLESIDDKSVTYEFIVTIQSNSVEICRYRKTFNIYNFRDGYKYINFDFTNLENPFPTNENRSLLIHHFPVVYIYNFLRLIRNYIGEMYSACVFDYSNEYNEKSKNIGVNINKIYFIFRQDHYSIEKFKNVGIIGLIYSSFKYAMSKRRIIQIQKLILDRMNKNILENNLNFNISESFNFPNYIINLSHMSASLEFSCKTINENIEIRITNSISDDYPIFSDHFRKLIHRFNVFMKKSKINYSQSTQNNPQTFIIESKMRDYVICNFKGFGLTNMVNDYSLVDMSIEKRSYGWKYSEDYQCKNIISDKLSEVEEPQSKKPPHDDELTDSPSLIISTDDGENSIHISITDHELSATEDTRNDEYINISTDGPDEISLHSSSPIPQTPQVNDVSLKVIRIGNINSKRVSIEYFE